MRILLSGGSGLLGSALAKHLSGQGHRVGKLVRRPARTDDEFQWDPAHRDLDTRHLDGVDAVVNLSGAGLASRPWTRGYVEVLYESRIDPILTLTAAMGRMDHPPKVFLSQSATGYYGPTSPAQGQADESSPSSPQSLLADICRRWEAAAQTAPPAIRTVNMRTGVVFTPDDGALNKLLLPLKLGIGGPLGSGKQYWPWISLPDLVAAIEFLLTHDISGPVNLSAPESSQVGVLVTALAKAFEKPARFRVPEVVLTTVMGQMAREMLLTSTRVRPAVLSAHGFTFQHPTPAAVAGWAAAALH
ncbi:TIGR01777 family protein [Paenarthrobacter sp. Z7-10]|uniref:TIGR01777 family oxidoreductase n=1 Tax=Paenarthrobacter sp. Z7-10 TaxID=2787635 RepID=UPI0022A99406|nr:TIGR01777 family oxidoreductase [Paenarthrobacter sp. Z7-10]MCZ2402388.1 TIGR01777 family protein [Paenarthrobacter sp. Z7-10]